MKVRAIAIATERSNAIGTVELECTPHGLALVYLGVGSFSEDYAPGALTMGTRIMVPWASVHEARVEGEQVFLALDSAATPHYRLTLVNFSAGDAMHHREVYRQRLVLRIGTVGTALVSLLVIALTVPRLAPHAGAVAALALGGATALAILAVGLLADRRVASGGADSDSVREAFAAELACYLPSLIRAARAPRPAPKLPTLPSFQGVLPRTTLAIIITLTAGMLGLVLMGRFIISGGPDTRQPVARERRARAPERPEPEPLTAQDTSSSRATRAAPTAPRPPDTRPAPAPAPTSDALAVTGNCQCDRSDSALWTKPISKLSALLLAKRKRQAGRHPRLELDIAAVNNSEDEISELTMMVQFFEQDPPPSSKRYPVAARSVYFQGPLGPGEAIKWTVEARGTQFEIQHPVEGYIGPKGEGAAPTNLLAQLLDANHRPVRLHGAMMLAYLGDHRAREAALKLRDALREDEAPYLERLINATADVRTCELRVSDSGARRLVKACVFNASQEKKSNLALRVRALDAEVSHSGPVAPPALVVAEGTWKLPAQLAPKRGVRISAQLDLPGAGEKPPAMFEAFADRVDLLQ